MPREFRFNGSIPMPENLFEEAALIVAIGEMMATIKLGAAALSDAAVVEFGLVAPKPRGAKDETPPVRGLTAAEAERRPEAA